MMALDAKKVGAVAVEIDRRAHAMAERKNRVLFAETFEGIGTPEEIARGLETLVSLDFLEARVQLRSSEGHLCWEGSSIEYGNIRWGGDPCPDLDCREPLETTTPIRYWRLNEKMSYGHKAIEPEVQDAFGDIPLLSEVLLSQFLDYLEQQELFLIGKWNTQTLQLDSEARTKLIRGFLQSTRPK